ncbi:MAG TPA: hypothetical protein VNK82_05830 [Terriglobales bacterium]|nr:hypothetical protein [Terriglobales bacterium]
MKRQLTIACWALAAFAMLSGTCVAQSESLSLGEIARQKPARKAARVFANEDLPRGVTETATPGAQQPAALGSLRPELLEGGSNPCSLADENRARVDTLRRDEASLRAKMERLQQRYDNETDEFRRNMYAEALQNSRDHLEIMTVARREAEKLLAGSEGSEVATSSDAASPEGGRPQSSPQQ